MASQLELPYRSAAPSSIARFESGVAVAHGKMFMIGGHMEPEPAGTSRARLRPGERPVDSVRRRPNSSCSQ